MIQKIRERFFTPPEDTGGRHNNFNLVRFVAAVMVIYGHMAHLLLAPVPTIFGQEVSTIAVKIFFVISGFLITESFLRDENIIRYGIRRFFRIMPGLIFITLLSVFIVGPLLTRFSTGDYFSNPSTYQYLRNGLLHPVYNLPGVFETNPYPNAVNGSLWSLPVEVAMYLLLPIVLVVFRKLKIMKIGVALTGVAFLVFNIWRLKYAPDLRFVFWGSNWIDGTMLVPYFFAGSLFSFPEFRRLLNLQWGIALAAVAAMLNMNYVKSEILLFIVLPYFILSFSLASRPVFGRWFEKNDYSYGMYLYGFLVQQTLIFLLGAERFSLLPYTILSTVVTLVFAALSWHLVERPCQLLGKRLLKCRLIARKKEAA